MLSFHRSRRHFGCPGRQSPACPGAVDVRHIIAKTGQDFYSLMIMFVVYISIFYFILLLLPLLEVVGCCSLINARGVFDPKKNNNYHFFFFSLFLLVCLLCTEHIVGDKTCPNNFPFFLLPFY